MTTLFDMCRTVAHSTTVAHRIMGVQPMQHDGMQIFKLRNRPPLAAKYNFSRAKWYEASLRHNSTQEQVTEILTWCYAQFGPPPSHQDAWSRWGRLGPRLKFRDEKDYIMYTLRWD